LYNLENIPMASFYEKSYMHKDIVDSVISAIDTDFIITTSLDGVLKFWKKNYLGIEFIKQYKAHSGRITGISVSNTSIYLSTCSPKDESLKIYDVINFDMINFVKLNFTPNLCCFINKNNDPGLLIALTEKDSGNIHIIKGDSKGEVLKTIKIHEVQVTSIKYNIQYNTVISSDLNGMIEYWNPETYGNLFFEILFRFT
jgi:peptidylprolyl isomerase domain and WD repeat-containing protein 1